MNAAIAVVTRLIRFATGLAFLVLIGSVLAQVVWRMTGDSRVWTEELARFALLFLAAFGAGLSFRSGDLVNVDLICEALPGPWPRRLRLVAAALTAGLCLLLISGAWRYMAIGRMQTSPALGWRMDFAHASTLVLIASLCLFAALRVVAMISGASDGQPDNRVEEPK